VVAACLLLLVVFLLFAVRGAGVGLLCVVGRSWGSLLLVGASCCGLARGVVTVTMTMFMAMTVLLLLVVVTSLESAGYTIKST